MFRIWEGRQSIGNGFGIDLDGFSARNIKYESILKNFHHSGCSLCRPAGPTWVLAGKNPSQLGFGPAQTQSGLPEVGHLFQTCAKSSAKWPYAINAPGVLLAKWPFMC